MREISEIALRYVDRIVDHQNGFEEAKDLIYHRDLEAPAAPIHSIRTLLEAIKKIVDVVGFRHDSNGGLDELLADLRKKTAWFVDNQSIYKNQWDESRHSHCFFVAYLFYLHDYGLRVPVEKLVEKQQLYHEFECKEPNQIEDSEEDKLYEQCKAAVYELCLWLNQGMQHCPAYRGNISQKNECTYKRWTDNK